MRPHFQAYTTSHLKKYVNIKVVVHRKKHVTFSSYFAVSRARKISFTGRIICTSD